jgi:N-acyl-D-amino-acid deacylase
VGQDPFAYVCDLLAVEGEAAFATFFGMSTANLDRILALPTAVVASDASVQAVHRQAGGGRPHPRCFDTFAYFLAEWVYARGVLTLPEAVRRITSLPARVARLDDRGTLTEGAYADLTVLDLALLEARTSYDAPMKLPPAVTDVIVNGAPVLVDGVHTLARPGRYLTAGRAAAGRGHGR